MLEIKPRICSKTIDIYLMNMASLDSKIFYIHLFCDILLGRLKKMKYRKLSGLSRKFCCFIIPVFSGGIIIHNSFGLKFCGS